MGATDAERQRRSRRHKAGDHSVCRPVTCPDASGQPSVTPVTPDRDPSRHETRGQRLWRELTASGEPSPARRVLMEEACRIADRLDRLDALLTGESDAWARFTVSDDGAEVTVTVDKALAEARQQQLALRAIVAELRQGQAEQPQQGGGILDQLAARRAARRTGAAGGQLPNTP